MKVFFSNEGPLFCALDRFGKIVILTIVWCIFCLPLITLIPATTAFYYAMIKSVRRGRGYLLSEFFHSFKSNLIRGIPLSIAVIALVELLLNNVRASFLAMDETGVIFTVLYVLFLFLLIGFFVYINPVLSRFSIQLTRLIKMAFCMIFRHLPTTILLSAGTVGCGMIVYYAIGTELPDDADGAAFANLLFLLLPGIWCYVTTFLLEPVLLKYMPKKQEGDNAWYYE